MRSRSRLPNTLRRIRDALITRKERCSSSRTRRTFVRSEKHYWYCNVQNPRLGIFIDDPRIFELHGEKSIAQDEKERFPIHSYSTVLRLILRFFVRVEDSISKILKVQISHLYVIAVQST
jgi:hypothetical protein